MLCNEDKSISKLKHCLLLDELTGDEAYGSVNTNLPANNVWLAPRGWISVGGTSSVIGYSLMSFYAEKQR